MQTVVRVWGTFLVLVPLLFFTNVSDKGLLAQTAVLSTLVGLGLLYLAVRKVEMQRLLHPIVGIALLVLVGLSLLGLWPAQIKSLGIGRAGTFLLLGGLALVLAAAFRTGSMTWLQGLRAWVGVMLFECILGFAQVLGWTDFSVLGEQPPMGTLAFRNGFCELMAVSTPLAVVLFRADNSAFKWLGLLATGLFSGMVWWQEVTGAQFAWALAIMVLGSFELGERLRNKGLGVGPLRWRMLGLGLVFVLGLLAGGYSIQQRIERMDSQSILKTQSSSEERMVMWNNSLQLFAEHPVLGVGTGQWPIHALEKGLVGNFQGFATRFYRRAHNDYLQLFAEHGLLGGLALLVLLVGTCALGWVRVEQAAADIEKRLLMGGLAGLAAWSAVALVTFPLERPIMLLLLGALLALVGAGKKASSPGSTMNSALTGLLGLLLLGFAWFSTMQHLAERHVFVMLEAKSQQNWAVVEREVRAARHWYLELESTTLSPLDWYLGTALLSQGKTEAGRDALRKAHVLHPWYPHTITNLAAAEAMTGDPNRASALLEEALGRFPEFDDARMNLVRLCVQFKHQDCIDQQVEFWEDRGIDPRINVFLNEMGVIHKGQP